MGYRDIITLNYITQSVHYFVCLCASPFSWNYTLYVKNSLQLLLYHGLYYFLPLKISDWVTEILLLLIINHNMCTIFVCVQFHFRDIAAFIFISVYKYCFMIACISFYHLSGQRFSIITLYCCLSKNIAPTLTIHSEHFHLRFYVVWLLWLNIWNLWLMW